MRNVCARRQAGAVGAARECALALPPVDPDAAEPRAIMACARWGGVACAMKHLPAEGDGRRRIARAEVPARHCTHVHTHALMLINTRIRACTRTQ